MAVLVIPALVIGVTCTIWLYAFWRAPASRAVAVDPAGVPRGRGRARGGLADHHGGGELRQGAPPARPARSLVCHLGWRDLAAGGDVRARGHRGSGAQRPVARPAVSRPQPPQTRTAYASLRPDRPHPGSPRDAAVSERESSRRTGHARWSAGAGTGPASGVGGRRGDVHQAGPGSRHTTRSAARGVHRRAEWAAGRRGCGPVARRRAGAPERAPERRGRHLCEL
jgi:hypothetical protein